MIKVLALLALCALVFAQDPTCDTYKKVDDNLHADFLKEYFAAAKFTGSTAENLKLCSNSVNGVVYEFMKIKTTCTDDSGCTGVCFNGGCADCKADADCKDNVNGEKCSTDGYCYSKILYKSMSDYQEHLDEVCDQQKLKTEEYSQSVLLDECRYCPYDMDICKAKIRSYYCSDAEEKAPFYKPKTCTAAADCTEEDTPNTHVKQCFADCIKCDSVTECMNNEDVAPIWDTDSCEDTNAEAKSLAPSPAAIIIPSIAAVALALLF